MFSHDNYTVFMISMRIGKQSIPLWFRCFKGKDCPDAFQEKLLKDGISYVSNLFGNNYKLIFLADRWLNSTSLMEHINSLGHFFVLDLKEILKFLFMIETKNIISGNLLMILEFLTIDLNYYMIFFLLKINIKSI